MAGSKPRFGKSIRARMFDAIAAALKHGWERFLTTSEGENRTWTCRRTCRQRLFSGASGNNFAAFLTEPQKPTAKWPAPLAVPPRFGPSLARARRILFRL